MSKIAFIYPGQGAQKAGMGADFYENSATARRIYDEASEALGLDMKELCFEKNDRLDLTEYTQAAMVTTCLAMTRTIEEQGLKPDITAGLSLGEYCAIASAGGIDDIDAVKMVRTRGILMQNTVPAGEGAMAAVLGLAKGPIEQVLSSMEDVTIANYNCPGQIVITGKTEAVQEACGRLNDAGARRMMPLKVSGPFHSPMLAQAGEKLGEELKKIQWKELGIPYVTNVTAQEISDIALTAELLARQVSVPVKWEQSMETMIQGGVNVFVEIGPGKTLTGFLRKIAPDKKVMQIGTWKDIETVIQELRAC